MDYHLVTNQSLLRLHDASAIKDGSKLDSLGNDEQIFDRKDTTLNSSTKKLLFNNILSDIKFKFKNKKNEKEKYNQDKDLNSEIYETFKASFRVSNKMQMN